MRIRFVRLTICIMVLGLVAPLAQAGGIPAGVGGTMLVETIQFENGMFNVGSETEPIQFFIDPDGVPWQKTFVVPIEPGVGLNPGMVFPVWEHLRIVSPPSTLPGTVPLMPFTDWHEVIHTPDWEWAPPIFDLDTGDQIAPQLVIHNGPDGPIHAPGMSGPGPDGEPTGLHTDMWFEWPGIWVFPDPNGLDVWIHKDLVYRGQPISNPTGELGFLDVHVWEYPTTPEPSSFVLAGMGLIGLIGLIRRRRSA